MLVDFEQSDHICQQKYQAIIIKPNFSMPILHIGKA